MLLKRLKVNITTEKRINKIKEGPFSHSTSIFTTCDKAFSADSLLLFPSHYTGQPGYISDTGTSTIWDDEAVVTYWERGCD